LLPIIGKVVPLPQSSGRSIKIFRRFITTLEFPDGQIVLLTLLEEGQQATVLQLPVTHEGAKVPEPKKASLPIPPTAN
jgi:hypothetical protein